MAKSECTLGSVPWRSTSPILGCRLGVGQEQPLRTSPALQPTRGIRRCRHLGTEPTWDQFSSFLQDNFGDVNEDRKANDAYDDYVYNRTSLTNDSIVSNGRRLQRLVADMSPAYRPTTHYVIEKFLKAIARACGEHGIHLAQSIRTERERYGNSLTSLQAVMAYAARNFSRDDRKDRQHKSSKSTRQDSDSDEDKRSRKRQDSKQNSPQREEKGGSRWRDKRSNVPGGPRVTFDTDNSNRGRDRGRSQSRGPGGASQGSRGNSQDTRMPRKKYYVNDADFKRRLREGKCTYCEQQGPDGRAAHRPEACPLMLKGDPPLDHKTRPKAGR